ncbi:MAG: hypothetical protein M1819_002111 [Sarea resinae]|nr:MAG: hypothetical protein M1819_002111 [Sarea resinae]
MALDHMLLRLLWATLPIVGLTWGQSIDCDGYSNTVTNATTADQLSSCISVPGDVFIQSGAGKNISFLGLTTIGGDLYCEGVPDLNRINFPSLREIGGKLSIIQLENLLELDLPNLTTVGNGIALQNNLYNLTSLSLDTGLSNCSSVVIQDTSLTSLKGFNMKSVDAVNVTDNPFLSDIQLSFANATGDVLIYSNGNGIANGQTALSFPSLQSVKNLNVSEVTNFSAPLLQNVTSSIAFQENNYLHSIELPVLGTVQLSLVIANNSELANVSLPVFRQIEDLYIMNNPKLSLLSMPKVLSVESFMVFSKNTALKQLELASLLDSSEITLNGSFSNVSFPRFEDGYSIIVDTTDHNFDCTEFAILNKTRNITELSCNGQTDQKKVKSAKYTGYYEPHSGLSSGSKIGIGVGIGVGVPVVLAIVGGAWFFHHRKRHQPVPGGEEEAEKAERAELGAEGPNSNAAEAHGGNTKYDKALATELDPASPPSELPVREQPGLHEME